MEQVLVLSVDRYRIPDQRTGEISVICQLTYISDYRERSADAAGYKPIKCSIVEPAFDDFHSANLPAVFELNFRTLPGKEGKPTLTVTGGNFVRTVDVFSVKDSKPTKAVAV